MKLTIYFPKHSLILDFPEKYTAMGAKHYRKFDHISHVLKSAQKVLIVAHTKPDPDAVGSVVSFKKYLELNYSCSVTLACEDRLPGFLQPLFASEKFLQIAEVEKNLHGYDIAIGIDSVDRGFAQLAGQLPEEVITIAIDHHHDIELEADISIIDASYASATEILYEFFVYDHGKISREIANALLTGIIGDTGVFQHSNTSPRTLRISSELTRLGASISHIVSHVFTNQKIETLSLWGKALSRVKFFPQRKLAIAALTSQDFSGEISKDNVREIATILVNTPAVDVALILFQLPSGIIKGSIRASKEAGVDVSRIAHSFGGGGHPLAAGFEIPGTLRPSDDGGWRVS